MVLGHSTAVLTISGDVMSRIGTFDTPAGS